MKRLAVGLALFFVIQVLGSAVPLTLLYTNDLHARLERFDGLAERIAAERASGAPVLLLDAGDAWQDFRVPMLAVWGAGETVSWMNEVGYDAMALGNHELYLGAEVLGWAAAQARFPLLCANLQPCPGIDAPFEPFVIRRVGALRILVIGLVTDDGLPYPDYPWLAYESPGPALLRTLRAAPTDVDLTIALVHLSLSEAVRLAEAAPGIDVFVTGHSHSTTIEPIRVGRSLVVQAGEFGRLIGRLRLDVDPATGAVRVVDNALLETEEAPAETGQGVVMLLALAGILAGLLALVAQNW